MKRSKLRNILALGLLACSFAANAQLHPPAYASSNAPNNFYIDYVGGLQLFVTEPQSISGPRAYTTSNDGSGGANEWGGVIAASIFDKELVKATPDSLACLTPTNSMTGKVAFIFRGDCEFGAKAAAAQAKGAIAAIIVNNIPGGPVGMGAGAQGAAVTIPVFMISQEDGLVINERMNSGETVKVSFTIGWGSGYADDLGILPAGLSIWHSYAIPKHQLGAGNGNPAAYKAYDGAFIANFGTSNASNVELKAVTSFTPDGSTTATEVRRDSFSFASFPTTDSVLAVGMNTDYDVHATQTGRFDVNYTLSSDLTDQFSGNNAASYSYYVTDNVFSKSRYNFAKNEPIATIFYRLSGTDPFISGNFFYVANGGYGATNAKFTVSKNGDPTLNGSFVGVLLYKWTDTLVADSLMQVGEMQLVGIGGQNFTTADTGGRFYTVDFEGVDEFGGPNGTQVELDGDSWYYLAALVPGDCYLGMDGLLNYYPRTYLRHFSPSVAYTEFSSSLFNGDQTELQNEQASNPLLTNTMFLFETGAITTDEAVDSARFSQQRSGFVPSISMTTSLFPLAVKNVPSSSNADVAIFPNPAKDVLNVSLKQNTQAAVVSYWVTDMLGRTVKRIVHQNVKDENTVISTEGLANGSYLLVIVADNKTTVRKFVIEK